ncbi:unnamed protein product [Heligmosomoides polygyrus]|uniref:Reverse transcriptase domain-containing protein n=1 Tax=Heligmosomoides polygyrus TaxID=6339 RepID=A0A183GGK7_HELPZ|nr:unnamed protein product [Heligmosomoides polygyrus]
MFRTAALVPFSEAFIDGNDLLCQMVPFIKNALSTQVRGCVRKAELDDLARAVEILPPTLKRSLLENVSHVQLPACHCNEEYIGETGRPLWVRVKEHVNGLEKCKVSTRLGSIGCGVIMAQWEEIKLAKPMASILKDFEARQPEVAKTNSWKWWKKKIGIKEYFKKLLNEEFPRREAEEEQLTEGPIQPWAQEEVRKAIGKMKLGKAAGPDGVPVEAWKMPDDWRNSTIAPIFKQKGDASECSNYRGIKLISHTVKIYERLVDTRLQWGFMPERSTTDAIFIARQKAYDRLARAVIWNALRGRGVPERLITVIRDMYEGSKAAIRTPHGVTRKVGITVGVHQGSALSPFLFLLTLDSIVNHLEEGPLRTILYADDIALVADNQEEVEEKVQLWQRALADNGLRLNVKKTKFISSEQCAGSILDCQGETIEKVQEFRYLGSDLSEEGSVDQAVRGRINAAWLKWRESTGILCDRRCSRTLKGKLYRTVVRSVLLYGSKCWALGKAQERQLHAAEMRMLRTVMKTAPIQLKMREQRLRLYGHILRRQEDHPTKALNFEAPEKRPRGALRKRRKDVIKRDLAEVGATADDALDRMRWRQITRTADPATARD